MGGVPPIHFHVKFAEPGIHRQTSFLRRFVPEAMFDKSLRKQMRLPV